MIVIIVIIVNIVILVHVFIIVIIVLVIFTWWLLAQRPLHSRGHSHSLSRHPPTYTVLVGLEQCSDVWALSTSEPKFYLKNQFEQIFMKSFQKQIGLIVLWPNHSGKYFEAKFGFLWKLFSLTPLKFGFSDSHRAQLSIEACPNTWLPKTLVAHQL